MASWWDVLLYLLPVLWIMAATVVALLLYRTSRALVEHSSTGPGGTRRVRLVGSIAIAVVVFLLLWKVTPSLVPDPATIRLTPAQERALNERRVALIQAWARYRACIDMPAVRSCPEQQGEMDSSVRQLDVEYRSALRKERPK